mmetsp:Transcript_25864/g.67821  ORF Transcript_25864/g.67821 Transcript_25864/m.67821 type:complete len:169 (-) Transcript_25864:167-673(-)|eukprot:CAMPEP_0194523302 /NCGR_PEP_ID=MMETSP0253-20130528/58154_1 /TAXON_ID=2966 /ORGANISM="Noctiluca scintillans" /LENGTH=168 /DNA_ID=CAMNT_0039367827 /DNA_START=32 /DNA_END=538 /DNA_ORIENTATION=+
MKFLAVLVSYVSVRPTVALFPGSIGVARAAQGVFLASVGRGPMYSNAPPTNASNAYPVQNVSLYHDLECKGSSTTFDSSGNAALTSFHPYIKNLASVKLCGEGSFFYYDTESMSLPSLLGHVTRCDSELEEDPTPMSTHYLAHRHGCVCKDIPLEKRFHVQSFTLQYC